MVQHLPAAQEGASEEALDERPFVVLLDFGLTKHLPDDKRLAFSRLVASMAALDISGLFISFKEMGLVLRREDPFEDLQGLRFAFRSTEESSAESRRVTMAYFEQQRAKFEALPADERIPVSAWPSELLLFFRCILLLRGLCASLEVAVPYLTTMSGWARRAMLERSPPPPPLLRDSDAHDSSSSSRPSLSARLRERLHDMQQADELVGVQVCVVHNGNVVVDIAGGKLHELDNREVQSSTLFPGVGIAQGVGQLAALHIVASSLAATEVDTTLVKDAWPGFGKREGIEGGIFSSLWSGAVRADDAPRERRATSTLSGVPPECHVLDLVQGDTARLPYCPSLLPEKFSMARFRDWKANTAFVAGAAGQSRGTAEDRENEKLAWELSHLAFAWGWGVIGLCEHVSAVASRGVDDSAPAVARALDQIASELGAAGELRFSMEPSEYDKNDAAVALLSVDLDSLTGGIDLDAIDMSLGPPDLGDFGPMLDSVKSIKGREYFLDPRLLNLEAIRGGVNPCYNVLCTARALARLYHCAFASGGKIAGGKRVLHSDVPMRARSLAEPGVEGGVDVAEAEAEVAPIGERLGVSRFMFRREATGEMLVGFGQVAFGGSFVCCVPELQVTMSLLVNQLSMEREVTRVAFEELTKEFGLVLVSEV